MAQITRLLGDFKNFILRGNVVDLAIAVVIGAAFNGVVQALVRDLVTPIIAAFGGKTNFSELYFMVNGSKFNYGDFINIFLSFILTAVALFFFVVRPVNAFLEFSSRRKGEEPGTKKCPYCYAQIPYKATKCQFCTSELPKSSAKK